MRVLLLKDHVYPVKPSFSLSFLKPSIVSNVIRYKAGTMIEVGADRNFIVNGQPTEHRLSDTKDGWTELYTRGESDGFQNQLHDELFVALQDRQRAIDEAASYKDDYEQSLAEIEAHKVENQILTKERNELRSDYNQVLAESDETYNELQSLKEYQKDLYQSDYNKLLSEVISLKKEVGDLNGRLGTQSITETEQINACEANAEAKG